MLIGNSAGPLNAPQLNGITIEMEACLDQAACIAALQGQKDVGQTPPMSVLWLTHSESLSPEQQCQRGAMITKELPWVQLGTDFFDGSHIVCNKSV